jgi:hypothetical protein
LEFLVYLNNARTTGIFLVSRDSFIQLGRILHYIVELILSKKDYESMRYLLVLTQTYYFINKYGQKIYLLRYIENHELFQSNEFWEFFFSDSIFQEIEKQNKSEQPEQETQEENKKRFSNVVFSKLLSLAHNMMEFKLEKEKIMSLISVFAKQYDVDSKLETQIITLVKEVEILLPEVVVPLKLAVRKSTFSSNVMYMVEGVKPSSLVNWITLSVPSSMEMVHVANAEANSSEYFTLKLPFAILQVTVDLVFIPCKISKSSRPL